MIAVPCTARTKTFTSPHKQLSIKRMGCCFPMTSVEEVREVQAKQSH